MNIRPRIIYTPKYDIRFFGVEKLHPFDSCKYSKTWQKLIEIFGTKLKQLRINPEHPATRNELLTVHTNEYLNRLNSSQYVAEALELFPLAILPNWMLNKSVLEPMLWATKGTIIGAEEALKNGIAINLSGGYHHASRESGEGFCLFADIAIAISMLRNSQKLKEGDKIIIIDLDAHQGNGLERIFHFDEDIWIFDMYNQDIYPQDFLARERIDCDIPLSLGTEEQECLSKLRDNLPLFLEELGEAKIAFYNAGTDIYEFDPLGGLKISKKGIFDRDKFVFNTLTNANIPWVMVLSGGYTKESYNLIANSVSYILQTWGNITEKVVCQK